MKLLATAICVLFTFLIAMQCMCKTIANYTADANVIQNILFNSEFNTEKGIIDILVERSNAQRQEIAKEYEKLFNKNLLEQLKNYFIYDIKEAITALMIPNEHFYAYQLHHAIEGLGTDEEAISEVLGSMNRDEILNVSAIYENDYRVSLKEDIISDTSGSFMDLLVSFCNVERNESTEVDTHSAIMDARALFDARKGHIKNVYRVNELVYHSILTTRSRAQLFLIFEEYEKLTNSSIIETIKEEFSNDLQYCFLVIVKSVFLKKSQFYAIQLYESMFGIGTNDRQLIRIIVGRSEIDLKEIREVYKLFFEVDLVDSVTDDTSGKYRDLLLAIIRK